MVEHSLQQGAAAPAAPAAPAGALTSAQLDAQLEIAAKKAALAGFEAQARGGPDAQASTGRIVIEKDGKTIVLDNPTTEQIAQLGLSSSSAPPLEGGALVTITGGTLVAIVAIVWMVLNRNRGRAQAGPNNSAELAARMARIENAIESVAVEVERISEGQRFTSKLIAEGVAVPVVAGARDEIGRRNGGEG